jgi:hypothetical protein
MGGGRTTSGIAAARGAAALCAGTAGFQAALAAGVPWGRAAWGGARAELPNELRIASGGASLAWATTAAALLAYSGDLGDGRFRGHGRLRRVAWGVTAVGGAGTLLNLATPSRIERTVWAPTSLALAVLARHAARSVEPSTPDRARAAARR